MKVGTISQKIHERATKWLVGRATDNFLYSLHENMNLMKPLVCTELKKTFLTSFGAFLIQKQNESNGKAKIGHT